MKVFYPKYYKEFQCIASACPDSCCKEWEVDVDNASAAFYRDLEGELGDRLRKVLKDTEDGTVMTIENGRCPMWRQDGLCRIQAELGHEALCQVCQMFPRLRHDYGDFVEYGLELSCPEAARLILTQSHEWQREVQPGGEAPEYDTEAMDILRQSREVVLEFLKATTLPANRALAVVLLFAHQVQSQLDGADAAALDVEGSLALAKKYAQKGDWKPMLSFFRGMEILTPQWKGKLANPGPAGKWHEGYLLLLSYFAERYWLQAVSDYDLIGRAKFAVAACLMIYRLGGDFVATAQLFSKEIENDPENLGTVLDGAYTSPALTDTLLLSLLDNG